MKKTDVRDLPLGLYLVHWKKDGGTSVAAVGMCSNGDRWLAPTNWVAPSTDPKVWRMVKAVSPITGEK